MQAVSARIKNNVTRTRFALTAARDGSTPVYRQWARLAWFYSVRKFSLREICSYDLLRTEASMTVFASKHESLQILARINPVDYRCLTENKMIFDAMCQANKLSVPHCYGVLSGGRLFDSMVAGATTGSTMADFSLPANFIAKPVDGAYGKHVTSWSREDNGWSAHDGERLSGAALKEKLAEVSQGTALILQERLYAHPDIEAVSGFPAVQAARLITLRESGSSSAASILYGTFKLLMQDSVTDNFSFGYSGNLLCAINIQTGTLRHAWLRDADTGRLELVTHHPITGQALASFQIPFWEDIVSLVQRAADVFHVLPAVGWDVAITPGGVTLLEGNTRWDPPFADLLSREDWERVCALAR